MRFNVNHLKVFKEALLIILYAYCVYCIFSILDKSINKSDSFEFEVNSDMFNVKFCMNFSTNQTNSTIQYQNASVSTPESHH